MTVLRQGDGFFVRVTVFRLRARPALVWQSEFCVVAVILDLTRNLWKVNGWVRQTLKRVQGDGSALGGLEAFVDFFQGVCQVLAYVFYGAVAALNFYREA